MKQINILAMGGAGANLLVGISNTLKETMILEGHPKVNLFHLDTSSANKDVSSTVDASFHHIKSGGVENKELQGSGGVRAANVKETVANIKDFINANLDTINEDSVNILVSSASGGSGSIISPLLKKQLMELNIPAIVILVGDSRSLAYAINTSDTVKTFHGIATSKDAAISMLYADNAEEPQADIDSYIADFCAMFVLFYNDKNLDMDPADMESFIDPTKRRPKIEIPAGIYDLTADSGVDVAGRMATAAKNSPIVSSRILNDVECIAPVSLDEKRGRVYDELAKEYEKEAFPIILYLQTNGTSSVLSDLDTKIDELNLEVKQDTVETELDEFGLHL